MIDMKSIKLSGMFLRGTLREPRLVMKSDSAGRVNPLPNEAQPNMPRLFLLSRG